MFGIFSDRSAPSPGAPSVIPRGLEGLRPGGIVTLDPTVSVLAQDCFAISADQAQSFGLDPAFVQLTALRVRFPNGAAIIEGTSSTPWNNGLILRFYLDDGGVMIQVVTDRQGQLLSPTIEVYSLAAEDITTDPSLWLPVNGSQWQQQTWWIGNAAFPLPGIPLDEEGVWPQWSYRRSWEPDPHVTAVAPRALSEVIRLSQGSAQIIEHQMMAYHRPPPSTVLDGSSPAYGPVPNQRYCEHLLLSAMVRNGQTVIQQWVGVECDPTDLIF